MLFTSPSFQNNIKSDFKSKKWKEKENVKRKNIFII